MVLLAIQLLVIINHVSAEMMELFGGKSFLLSISDVLPKSPYILFFLCHSTVAIGTTIATQINLKLINNDDSEKLIISKV